MKGISLIMPRFFLDNFIVTPHKMQEARRELMYRLDAPVVPKSLSLFNGYIYVEEGWYKHPLFEPLLPIVNIPLGFISICTFSWGKKKAMFWMLEPKVMQMMSSHERIRSLIKEASGVYRIPNDSKGRAPNANNRSPYNQLYVAPFTYGTESTNWSWNLGGSKLVLIIGKNHYIPCEEWIMSMCYLKHDGRYYISKGSGNLVKVYYNDGSGSYIAITNQSTIVFYGKIDYYAKLMIGLFDLIKDTLKTTDPRVLGDFRRLKKSARWVTGVRN